MLTRDERRRLRQLERTLCVTDAGWARRHEPRRRRLLRQVTRLVVDVAAVWLIVVGVAGSHLSLVFTGIVFASCGATAHVSAWPRRPHLVRPRTSGHALPQ